MQSAFSVSDRSHLLVSFAQVWILGRLILILHIEFRVMVMVVALCVGLMVCPTLALPMPDRGLSSLIGAGRVVQPVHVATARAPSLSSHSNLIALASHLMGNPWSDGALFPLRVRTRPLRLPDLRPRLTALPAPGVPRCAPLLGSQPLLDWESSVGQVPSDATPGVSRTSLTLLRLQHPLLGRMPCRCDVEAAGVDSNYFFNILNGDAPSFIPFHISGGVDVSCGSATSPALGVGRAPACFACADGEGSTCRPSGLCEFAGVVYSTSPSSYVAFGIHLLSSTFKGYPGSCYAVPLVSISDGFHLADYGSLRRRRRRLDGGSAARRGMNNFITLGWHVLLLFLRGTPALAANVAISALLVDVLSLGLSTELTALARVGIISGWLTSVGIQCGVSIQGFHSLMPDGRLALGAGRRELLGFTSRALFWLSLASLFNHGEAVCLSCNGNDPNCPGDNTCAMAVALAANAVVMAGGATAASALDMGKNGKPILPLTWLQVLKPAVLEALVALARRKPLGTPTALRDLSLSTLLDALISGSTPQGEARLELARRITSSSTSSDEKAQIKLVCEVLPKSDDEALVSGGGKFSEAGALQYVYAISMRIVRQLLDPSKISVAGGASGFSGSGSTATALTSIDLKRPKTVSEFLHSLTVWQSVLSAVGLSSAVVLGPFLSDVVHLPMVDHGWEVALEHFLLYIQKIDSGCGWELASATSQGSQDTFLNKAIRMASSPSGAKGGQGHSKHGVSGGSGTGGDGASSKVVWNGKFNTDPSAKPCAAFNTGAEHKRLRPDGSCPFGHTCDHWVKDKGPGGKCGSSSHCRSGCTNPARVDSKVE